MTALVTSHLFFILAKKIILASTPELSTCCVLIFSQLSYLPYSYYNPILSTTHIFF